MPDIGVPRYLTAFRRDVEGALRWSEDRFGRAAADRYGALIAQALRDLLDDPLRPGARPRADLGRDALVYHLAFSRDRMPVDRVKTPRHFVLYRVREGNVQFARLLHESRDLPRLNLEQPTVS